MEGTELPEVTVTETDGWRWTVRVGEAEVAELRGDPPVAGLPEWEPARLAEGLAVRLRKGLRIRAGLEDVCGQCGMKLVPGETDARHPFGWRHDGMSCGDRRWGPTYNRAAAPA